MNLKFAVIKKKLAKLVKANDGTQNSKQTNRRDFYFVHKFSKVLFFVC